MKLDYVDLQRHFPFWDKKIKDALSSLQQVEQPLISFCDAKTTEALQGYLEGKTSYPSVATFVRAK